MRSEERRRYPRFPHGTLSVTLHRPGLRGILNRRLQSRCLDYSRCGIGVVTQHPLRVGDRLIVDLLVAGLRADELVGIVATTTAGENGQHCGIRFELDRLHRQSLTEHALCEIENCLCRQHRDTLPTTPDAA